MYITVRPTNGVDYISEDAVQSAWKAGQDFIVLDIGGHSLSELWRANRAVTPALRRINSEEVAELEAEVSVKWRNGTRSTDVTT
jgi:hypothetical protein